jgi:hypothetical protein
MTSDPRLAWLDAHCDEIGDLIKGAVALGLSRAELALEVIDRLMSMSPPPPGGLRSAQIIAQIVDAGLVAVDVPETIPPWMDDCD